MDSFDSSVESTRGFTKDLMKMEQRATSSSLPANSLTYDSHVTEKKSHRAPAGIGERAKRPYTKKRDKNNYLDDEDKPPPKKRGRKSKKELQMMGNKKSDISYHPPASTKTLKLKKSLLQQVPPRSTKKASLTKMKKSSVTSMSSSVFDRKIFVGPHLTMKQVLEYILTDHSYCVPPDPLPAVGSSHQMIRYILGPKNGSKATPLPLLGMIESGERSPLPYHGISRSRGQLNLSSTPPPSSKLEHLLKRDAPTHGISLNHLRFSHPRSASECRDESDVEIDVTSVDSEGRIPYDVPKAVEVMNECDKYVGFARNADTGDDWETKLMKTGWTKTQNSLYDKIIAVLHAERLARLAYEHIGDAEPVLRRASVDRTASRIRRIFGEYLWDTKLTQWLHGVLIESLNYSYLAIYLDVLQTLKSQCPQLIKRMITLSVGIPLQQQADHQTELANLLTPFLEPKMEEYNLEVKQDDENKQPPSSELHLEDSTHKESTINDNSTTIYLPERTVVPQMKDVMLKLHSAKHAEAIKALLGRQWDPFAPVLLHRLKKLASNPVFLMIVPCAIFPRLSLNRRLRQYHDMFRRVGKIVTVSSRNSEALEYTSVSNYIEKLMYLAKEKIKEIRSSFSDRPLYIVGWGSGSILAARLSAAAGPVEGIIALGFPLLSLKPLQEDLFKAFCGIKHPVLFVIGGLASNNSLTDMELFRKRLACETSLVVVGSGNENLYVSRAHREKLFVTQSYVDKNVMDEIAYFVNLHSKHGQVSATIAANISMKTPYPKAHNDNTGKKQPVASRARKRTSSVAGIESENSFVEDANSSSNIDPDKFLGGQNTPHKGISIKREVDSKSLNTYDYDFDGPKFIPSNKSSNKRKAYYRPDPSSVSSSVTSSNIITASKLVQQSPNAKRRMSKPSGPSPRLPLLGQQPSQRGNSQQTIAGDIPTDNTTGLLKYLGGTTVNEPSLSSIAPPLPIVLRQTDGAYQSGGSDSSSVIGTYSSRDTITTVSTKPSKKRTISKSKAARVSKGSSTESPSLALTSAITDVSTPNNSSSSSTPASSLDMHKYVLQHQQMIKQLEQHRQDRPQTSQLYKLLSPSDSTNSSSLSLSNSGGGGVSQSSEVVKLKLVGTPPVASELMMDTRATTLISKQNLVSNMSLPMIRLSKPDDSSQKSLFVSGPSPGPLITNLPADAKERYFVRTTDKGLVTLNATDVKCLIEGGRAIQVVSNMPSTSAQSSVNILVKKQDATELETVTPVGNSVPQATLVVEEALPNQTTTQPSVITTPESATSTDNVSLNANLSHSLPSESNSFKPTEENRQLQKIDPPLERNADHSELKANKESEDDDKHVDPIVDTCKEMESHPVHTVSGNEHDHVTNETSEPNAASTDPISENSAQDSPEEPTSKGTVATEPTITEPIEDDEEMSGLMISSTFSVCPVSGERVLPETPDETSAGSDSTKSTSDTNENSKKPLRRSARLKSGL